MVVGNPARVIKTFTDYIEENRNRMTKENVWDTHYSKKSQEEKKKMKEFLSDGGIGYDL